MSLSTNVSDVVTRIGTEIKALRTLINGNAVDLAGLTTTAKTNLVAAINELDAAIDALSGSSGAPIDDENVSGVTTYSSEKIEELLDLFTQINDGVAALTTTWSSTKISNEIGAAVSALVDGAGAALNTLNELAAALGNDANFATTTATALANRVRTDTAAQGLDATAQSNARTNINAASATDVGPTNTNYVTTFEAALV